MQRIIDFIEKELQILEAVWSYRIRSFVLLIAAFVVPSVVALVGLQMIATSPLLGLAQSMGALFPVLTLVLMLKLLSLAVHEYLKDRAAMLRF